MASMNDVLAVILGGGRGTRLYPLTKLRAKPAVPFGAKYRLIDIPISNCINSSIFHIAVLTQFLSVSLHRHIASTYNFDMFHSGYVHIWAAEQTMELSDWYQGTADAVRKQLFQIRSARTDYVLILAGDHFYRMNYQDMVQFHWEKDADVTVAVQPVRHEDVARFGVLKRDSTRQLVNFAEKPTDPALLKEMVSREDEDRPYLGSMGIYLFKTDALIDILSSNKQEDFGKHIIPSSIGTHKVYGFDFDGYWEDIGTIRKFYETNLSLTSTAAPFDLYDQESPIYTHPRFLPGTVIENSQLNNVLLGDGCVIKDSRIDCTVIGMRSKILGGANISDSVLMGADYYRRDKEEAPNTVPIGIGENSQIQGAIIDKNARIGSNVIIRPFPRGTDIASEYWSVRDGIVVIPKNATLTPDTYIGPE
jgi:glucose-1-phosphate adenylyltransferase